MSKKEMEDKLADKIFYLLQPHDIRVKAYENFLTADEE
jgi:isocitrate dehydrogenase kinase/phosphatase